MTGQAAANIGRIRELASEGLNTAQIAERLDVVQSYVRHLAIANNINVLLPVSQAEARRAEIRRLAALGKTYQEIAAATGLTYHSVVNRARKYGIPVTLKRRGAKPKPIVPTERTRQMAALYQSGKTLQEIGDQFNLTRERVRQIIGKWHGLKGMDGGQHKSALEKRAKFEAKRNAASLKKWGCNWDQYVALRDQKKITRAYASQRKNADRRGIGWEFNLWQWWSIWQQSGKWEQRGRGNGFMMCRVNDTGPYAVGNVFIATGCENSSREHAKTSGLPRGVALNRGRYIAHRCIGGKKLYLGAHPTPELAHAAYLAARPTTNAETRA